MTGLYEEWDIFTPGAPVRRYKMTDTQPMIRLLKTVEPTSEGYRIDPITYGRLLQVVETLNDNVRALDETVTELTRSLTESITALNEKINQVRTEQDEKHSQTAQTIAYSKGMMRGMVLVSSAIGGIATAMVMKFIETWKS